MDDERRLGFTLRRFEVWVAVLVNLIAIATVALAAYRREIEIEDRIVVVEAANMKQGPVLEQDHLDVAVMKAQQAAVLASIVEINGKLDRILERR